ncbi:MAG: twin-arginine translocase TatA/TatE family subunit [Selenomonadaceae bacterium]|nr:twin-arginine translocase TatA/TatE family subunit [Selenomonadaceae bacterium]
MFGIGAGEFALILIVGLIVFGPSKLPELGRSLGKLLREFRKAQAALSNVVNEVDQAPIKPSTAARTETISTAHQEVPQEEQTVTQVSTSSNADSSASPSARIDQVTEMINANPIKLTKEPVER